jgi:hypothetical protein
MQSLPPVDYPYDVAGLQHDAAVEQRRTPANGVCLCSIWRQRKVHSLLLGLTVRLQTRETVSLRGAAGDEAIFFLDKDCFATLAMTAYLKFADTL